MGVLGERREGETDPVGNVVAREGVPDLVGPAGVLGSNGVENDVEETSRTVPCGGGSAIGAVAYGGVISTFGIGNGVAASGE